MGLKIAIVLLNWNGKQDTLECLASLAKLSPPPTLTLVVDNASSDDSVETFREAYPDLPILQSPSNLGYAGGNNLGIQWALQKRMDWILLLNNDTTVPLDFLDSFLKASQERPEVKIWGPKILRYHQPEIVDHFGGMWQPHLAEFESLYSGAKDHPLLCEKQVDYVCGAALFCHRSVFEAIGVLEPSFFLFWEESDFCHRAQRAGFQIWVTPQVKVWHKISASFKGGKPHTHYFWWRSRLLFLKRNCSPQEKKRIDRTIVFPQILKLLRHFLIKWAVCLFFPSPKRKEQKKRLKAGLAGVFHFYTKRFGPAPSWIFSEQGESGK